MTDAARYMSLAGKTLKELYPLSFFDACQLRCALLQSCAIRVRAQFKNIDEVIATIKAATKIARKIIFMMLDCHILLTVQLLDGKLALELPYITMRTFQLFEPLQTIG